MIRNTYVVELRKDVFVKLHETHRSEYFLDEGKALLKISTELAIQLISKI